MASIRQEFVIDARAEDVWEALRDFGNVHTRLATGFVVDAHLEGDDRVVTFAGLSVARERLVDCDDEMRRLVYTVVEGRLSLTHHNASAQVFDEGDGRSRFVWITDVLPHEAAPIVAGLMEQGATAMQRTLEKNS